MSYELYHHGVKGMKWGVRRYQNKDGSLTAAGRKRLKKDEQKLDIINERIFKDRLIARSVDQNDPGTYLGLSALSDRVRKQSEAGEQVVASMKKKGLISDDVTFREYTAKYEQKVINDCKKYVSEKYKLSDVTDDDVNYFIDAYICGAI